MGNKHRKRKRNDEDSVILKKLRKLEKKVSRRHRRSSSISETTSESEKYGQITIDSEHQEFNTNPTSPLAQLEEIPLLQDVSEHTLQENEIVSEEVKHLDDNILELLGDAPQDNSPLGPEIHTDIALRLQDVLLNGLKRDNKLKIMELYPVPGNCLMFKAPIINPEIKAAVSELLVKKDLALAARQDQTGIVLTALTRAMDILVNQDSINQDIIKHLSNACRLLCDSHYNDNKMRKKILISTLNNKLKDTLKEAKRDKFLFGENLSEKIKTSKAINKFSDDLKGRPRSIITKNAPNNKQTKNWKHPQPNHPSNQTTLPYRSAGPSARLTRNDPRNNQRVEQRREPQRGQPSTRARGSAHYSYKRRQ